MHAATAFAPVGEAPLPVELVGVVLVLVLALVGVVAGLVLVEAAELVEALEPEELLELPQPTISAAAASRGSSRMR